MKILIYISIKYDSKNTDAGAPQTALFDDVEPLSPREDIGYSKPAAAAVGPPAQRRPVNHAPGTIGPADVEKFVNWICSLEGITKSGEITIDNILWQLSGFQPSDLRWLCIAIKQAGHAPAPSAMRQALLSRDVAKLRVKR